MLIGFVSATAIELAYRFQSFHSFRMPSPNWVYDPDLIFRLNPKNPDTPLSFRGKAPEPKRKAGIFVVCLGGSTTFGHELKSEESWPHILEEVLQNLGIRAEVINAGVPGYGSRHLLVRYRKEIAPLRPDIVILYTGWNRTGALVESGVWNPWIPYGIARPEDSRWQRLSLIGCDRSLLFRKFVKLLLSHSQPKPQWYMDPYHETYVSDLRELIKEIKLNGQRPILVVYPALYHQEMSDSDSLLYEKLLWQGVPYTPNMLDELKRKHSAIRQLANKTKSILIDAQQAFRQFKGEERAKLFMDEMHPTVEGNRLIAEIIGRSMTENISKRSLLRFVHSGKKIYEIRAH